MAWYHEIFSSLGALVGRRRQEREMDEEVRFHIEMETRRNVETGLSEAEARRRAVRDFGGVERHKDDVRDERGDQLVLRRLERRTLRRALPPPARRLHGDRDAHARVRHRRDDDAVRRREAGAPDAAALRPSRERRRRLERVEGLRPDVALVRRMGRMEGAHSGVRRHRHLLRRLGRPSTATVRARSHRRMCR